MTLGIRWACVAYLQVMRLKMFSRVLGLPRHWTRWPSPSVLPVTLEHYKDEVADLIQYLFISGAFKKGVNNTNLVFILKECQTSADFGLIVLCNVTYKVVEKILANKIRPYLMVLFFPLPSSLRSRETDCG